MTQWLRRLMAERCNDRIAKRLRGLDEFMEQVLLLKHRPQSSYDSDL